MQTFLLIAAVFSFICAVATKGMQRFIFVVAFTLTVMAHSKVKENFDDSDYQPSASSSSRTASESEVQKCVAAATSDPKATNGVSVGEIQSVCRAGLK